MHAEALVMGCGERLNPRERTKCEVWTRVMGYHRPIAAFNAGKRSEHADRAYFREPDPARAAHPNP